jgi:hypothetical protein
MKKKISVLEWLNHIYKINQKEMKYVMKIKDVYVKKIMLEMNVEINVRMYYVVRMKNE